MKREKKITCMKIMAAVAVCAAGVALLVLADWGLDPLTNFEYALSRKLHISLGKASMLFEGLTFFLFFFSNPPCPSRKPNTYQIETKNNSDVREEI